MSLMVSFCAVFFARDVLDEIWDLIESVSEVFPIYSYINQIPKSILKSRFYTVQSPEYNPVYTQYLNWLC